MGRRTAALVGIAAFAIGAVSVADAGATPTEPPNCHGQLIKRGLAVEREHGVNGLGGAAHEFDMSLKEIQAFVDEECRK